MKKYILFIIILFIGFLCCGCFKKNQELNDLETILQRGYLIAGVKEDSPPFGYFKDNELKGIDIDIAKAIANEIFQSNNPANIQFVKVNPQNRISKLSSKEVDILVATMSVNEKRKLVVDFSIPYFIANQKLMVKKDSKISHIQEFNTKGRLGVILGTTGEKITHLVSPTARITGARSYKEALELLKTGQIDGIIGDDCILKSYLTNETRIINKAYSKEFYAVAVRKSDKSLELLNKINSAITVLLDEKKLNFKKG